MGVVVRCSSSLDAEPSFHDCQIRIGRFRGYRQTPKNSWSVESDSMYIWSGVNEDNGGKIPASVRKRGRGYRGRGELRVILWQEWYVDGEFSDRDTPDVFNGDKLLSAFEGSLGLCVILCRQGHPLYAQRSCRVLECPLRMK